MVDHVTEMGTLHRWKSQDYAISQILTLPNGIKVPVIITADGCSSAGNTEIGSQIISLSIMSSLKEIFNMPQIVVSWYEFKRRLENRLDDLIDRLQISFNDMISTFQVAFVYDGVLVYFKCGDGTFFFKEKESDLISIHSYEYPDNAPEYIAFNLSIYGPLMDYLKKLSKTEPTASYKEIIKNVDNKSERYEVYEQIKERPIFPQAIDMKTFDISNLEYFGIATDGIDSYRSPEDIPFDSVGIIKEMVSIKNGKGQFVERRFQAMQKSLKASGKIKGHFDDVSIAIINLKDADYGTN